MLKQGSLAAIFALLSISGASAADAFRYLSAADSAALVGKPGANNAPAIVYISRSDAFQIQDSQRFKTGDVETHGHYYDYITAIEGEASIVIGGTVIDNKPWATGVDEWIGASSTGGTVYALTPGAMIVIPPGTPHQIQIKPGGHLHYVTVKKQEP